MVVMPVSIANTGVGVFNRTNFTGHSVKNDSEKIVNKPVAKTSNLAKVPVVVMIAMSPAMLNAKTPVTGLTGTEGAKTELVAALPSAMEEIDEITAISPEFSTQQTQQNKFPFGLAEFSMHDIKEVDSFIKNGKKYYITYSALKGEDKNTVSTVRIFPEGFQRTKETPFIPEVRELIYHDLGPEKEFCGVIVSHTTRDKNGDFHETEEEVRLPDESAQKLIDLMANDTKWHNGTFIKYSETKSAKLRPKQKIY